MNASSPVLCIANDIRRTSRIS